MAPSIAPFILFFGLGLSTAICPAKAGFFDVKVAGRITDEGSGQGLSFAQVMVLSGNASVAPREIHTDAKGNYILVLNSGSSGFAFGDQTLVFGAEGHQPRRVVLELSGLQKSTPGLCWRIQCDVALRGPGGALKDQPLLLDTCRWEPSKEDLQWKEAWANKAFPIERSLDEELAAVETRLMARGEGMMIYGLTVDQWTWSPLPGVPISIRATAGEVRLDTTLRADGGGRYALLLQYGASYRLEVGGSGHVHKILEFDLTDPRLLAVTEGFGANVDLRLFEPLPSEDLAFLAEPMGRMVFDPEQELMVWDMQHLGHIKQRLDAILARHRPR